jgi:uncharacterized membrane protein YphA (DoxX/SURF4 family)
VEKILSIFVASGYNNVLMFERLFCSMLAIQLIVNFKAQLRYFKTQPYIIYGKPVKLLAKFQIPAVNETWFVFFGIVLILCLITAAIGFCPQLFLLIALLCYFPYFSSIISLADIQRKTNLIPLVLLVLMVSPSLNHSLYQPSTRWEIVLIKISIAQMYFSAGLQKLGHSFRNWCNGKSLQAFLFENYLWSDRKIGFKLAQNQQLCAILSTLTLFFELTFGIIVLVPGLTFYYVAAAVLFHLGTLIAMRINYLKYMLPVYMVFLPGVAFWIMDKL